MTTSGAQREKTRSSLLSLLEGLVGEQTTIELHNDSSVHGEIVHVDGSMGVELTGATRYSRHPKNLPERYDRFFVVGKQIRFVHIPKHVDMVRVMMRQIETTLPGTSDFSKKKMDKKKRLQMNFEKWKKKADTLKALGAETTSTHKPPNDE